MLMYLNQLISYLTLTSSVACCKCNW